METTVYLIRTGVTPWHAERRVLGQSDIPLSRDGLEQAAAVASTLSGVKLAEVLSSPKQRAVETAEIIGRAVGIEVARDPRLDDVRLGKWGAMTYAEVAATGEYQEFLRQPDRIAAPGGESLLELQRRALAAVEQVLSDCPYGDAVAIVTHADIIRVLINHYMGSPPGNYRQLLVSPGSISILSFADSREPPRVLAINLAGSIDHVVRRSGSRA
ncbi:MAG TPA: histidine phosphatase family protein [Candidatus Acidoferrum sp.]|nr:histidine phosphatase family protein [Candidatus Acidoferrum sp.]